MQRGSLNVADHELLHSVFYNSHTLIFAYSQMEHDFILDRFKKRSDAKGYHCTLSDIPG